MSCWCALPQAGRQRPLIISANRFDPIGDLSRRARPPRVLHLYVKQNLPGVRRLLIAKLNVQNGQNAVVSGTHANQLAEGLAERLKRDREMAPTLLMERIHLFVSAPNAFTSFLLSRHQSIELKPHSEQAHAGSSS